MVHNDMPECNSKYDCGRRLVPDVVVDVSE